jgi:hypothetical protein
MKVSAVVLLGTLLMYWVGPVTCMKITGDEIEQRRRLVRSLYTPTSVLPTQDKCQKRPEESGFASGSGLGSGFGSGDSCTLPKIQLHGGRHKCEGVLRVKDRRGNWITACHRYFSNSAKEVVCRQLGCGPL